MSEIFRNYRIFMAGKSNNDQTWKDFFENDQ